MAQPAGTQAEVRRTMLDAGGYWRPLAAAARLLEELGELGELLEGTDPSRDELASELADLWIITTALADQFLIAAGEPRAGPPGATRDLPLGGLVMAAGQIARVVNYYDGPKTPRADRRLPSLTEAIGAFHRRLELLSGALGVDLGPAVSAKLAVIRGRDMERFAREASDPSTAAVLALLKEPWLGLRLWGAPVESPAGTPGELAGAVASSLSAFTKAAGPERLDGFVIGAPERPGSRQLERWLAALVEELGRLDPAPQASRPAGLSFNGLGLSLEILPAGAGPAGGGVPARSLLLLRAGGQAGARDGRG